MSHYFDADSETNFAEQIFPNSDHPDCTERKNLRGVVFVFVCLFCAKC